ncbi:MAG TPA: hypothetical protein VI504_02040, partial [Candidatus Eisenbacteria bacterium]
MKPDVRVLVVERGDQRRHGNRVADVAKREGGVHPQVGLGVGQQLDQRRGDVAIGRQHLQRAADDVEVLIAAAQRVEQVRDLRRRGALAQVADGEAAQLPVTGADRFDRARRRLPGRGAFELRHHVALPIELRRDVLDGDHRAEDVVTRGERRDGHELLHLAEVRRWLPRRTGEQVVMEGGRQHARRAGGQH